MFEVFIEQLLQTTWPEGIAALLGLAYLLLAVRRDLWCWVCAFVSVSIYLVLFAQAKLYMQSVLHVFYLAMAVYGFLQWRKGRDEQGDVRVERWPVRAHVASAIAVCALTWLNGWWLANYTQAAAPYLDSFVTWGSVLTTLMVTKRLIENWLYWVVIDSAGAYLYFQQGLIVTGLLFVLYVGIVIHGFLVWRRAERAKQWA